MSGILEQLVAVVTRNNELLEQAAAGREKVLTAVEGATTAKPKAKAADKPAETAAEKPVETAPAAAADGEFTHDKMKASVSAYIGHDREEERKARSAKVSELFGKVGAKTVSDITEAKFIKAVTKAIATLSDHGEITQAAGGEEGEAEVDLMG